MSAPQDSDTRQPLQQLLAKYHELAELAGSLAHEIKNPLSVIRMNMDLLAEDLAEAETPRERRALRKVDVVHTQCTRLENLLNDFLKFTRLQELNLLAGNLNEVLGRVCDLFAVQAVDADVEIRRYLDPDLPSILIDAETLEAAIVNLVKNAMESMPEGGTLTATTRLTKNSVALDLIDTGCGMGERTALNMFDAFYTTKNGGSGLGLPTARKVVEAHGGRISVQSVEGRGTKFTLEFPAPARISKVDSDSA
ncbi:MAG: sensor histidine kinase [Planctomycetaceae bacterium]|nr:sensor histidine kinase [Planctomycetaceae bacterium]